MVSEWKEVSSLTLTLIHCHSDGATYSATSRMNCRDDWLDLGNTSQFQGMAICMEAMDLEHCFPPQEIAERLTQMCRSKHESNDTECTGKPEELAEDESEENADEG